MRGSAAAVLMSGGFSGDPSPDIDPFNFAPHIAMPARRGGTNPAGWLRPARPVTNYLPQDAYTEYALLEPGSESFRIRYLPETRAGATELVNATRGGSEGSDIEVYDPRTGKPL